MELPKNGNGNGNIQTRVLWWLVTALTGLVMGMGSNWVTRMEHMAALETKVEVLAVKVDDLTTELRRQNHTQRQVP